MARNKITRTYSIEYSSWVKFEEKTKDKNQSKILSEFMEKYANEN